VTRLEPLLHEHKNQLESVEQTSTTIAQQIVGESSLRLKSAWEQLLQETQQDVDKLAKTISCLQEFVDKANQHLRLLSPSTNETRTSPLSLDRLQENEPLFFSTTHYTIEGALDKRLNGKYRNSDILEAIQSEEARWMPLDELKHLLTDVEHAWDDTDGNDFTAMELFQDWNNVKYQHHKERVEQTDLRHPLVIWYDSDPDCRCYKMVDGMHRLLKAHMENRSHVMVKQVKDTHFLAMRKS
jgi:hypothetical protein